MFTNDGNSIVSPTGNRITVIDLKNQHCRTLNFESRKNIFRLALSRCGNILAVAETDGRLILVNFHKGNVLNHINTKKKYGV